MIRHNEYTLLRQRIEAIKRHAQQKGDGILADKARKMLLNVSRLEKTDSTPMNKETDDG